MTYKTLLEQLFIKKFFFLMIDVEFWLEKAEFREQDEYKDTNFAHVLYKITYSSKLRSSSA